MSGDRLTLGAVAYDPKVVTIWDGFRRWFPSEGLEVDYVLYSNYERRVEELLAGAVDVAWNSRWHGCGPGGWLKPPAVAPGRWPCVTATATSPRSSSSGRARPSSRSRT